MMQGITNLNDYPTYDTYRKNIELFETNFDIL